MTIEEAVEQNLLDEDHWIVRAKTKNANISFSKTSKIIWHDGIWEDGIWEDGTWLDGIWENGIWVDGTWINGSFEKGKWIKSNGMINTTLIKSLF